MLICYDRINNSGCGAENPDGTKRCQQCGALLRYALELQNPGTHIKTYRIIEIIGYGGFGAVYKAEDTRQSGHYVALKETLYSDTTRAFQGEFAILHRLNHDHLPHYYDMFEDHGNGYLVMEYIPGQSLQNVLDKRNGQPLVEGQVIGYVFQICDALTYLHTQNPTLIHRDIKPDNIRITPDGLIKLVDFGLFKQGDGTTRSSRMGGTCIYAPLEQWGGTNTHTTPQSDIYSLGVTLYQLLTCKLPPLVTDRLAVSPDPLIAPHHINPRLSAHVSDAIVQALQIQPYNRFADAATFKRALMDGVQPSSPPPPSPSRINPLFPMTVEEWRDEINNRNELFGKPTGYWCYVHPGKYDIGGWDNDEKLATISLEGFWIAKYPITVQQYRQFMTIGGYTNKSYWTDNGWLWKQQKNRSFPHEWNNIGFSNDTQPVIGTTWYEANAFASWLDRELAGTLPSSYQIRLPTEAEWEVAAAYDAKGQRHTYPWGEQEPNTTRADFNKFWFTDKPASIGERPAGTTACGAQDLVGSVWEVTSSSYEGYPAVSNRIVEDVISTKDVPWRGGSWADNRNYTRCSARSFFIAFFYFSYVGLRLVYAPKQP